MAHVSRLAGRSVILAFAGLAFSLTVGCATSEPGPRGPDHASPKLFVSPFGEIFTAEPDQPWPVADWFSGADANHDGAMTYDEFVADGRRWFAVLDRDRDGRLSPGEIAAYETRLHPFSVGGPGGFGGYGGGGGRPDRGGPPSALGLASDTAHSAKAGDRLQDGPPGGGGGTPRPPRARIGSYGPIAQAGFFNLPEPVKAADANTDQTVTTAEWAAYTRDLFLTLDTDHDERLTLETLPQTPAQQRGSARRHR